MHRDSLDVHERSMECRETLENFTGILMDYLDMLEMFIGFHMVCLEVGVLRLSLDLPWVHLRVLRFYKMSNDMLRFPYAL